jgi:hypothetical protein
MESGGRDVLGGVGNGCGGGDGQVAAWHGVTLIT